MTRTVAIFREHSQAKGASDSQGAWGCWRGVTLLLAARSSSPWLAALEKMITQSVI